MSISKFNKGTKVDWGFNTDELNIIKCRDLEEGKTYPLRGFFTTKDNGFGEGCILISDDFLVGIPGRYNEQIREMLRDEETIEEVKAGKCAFKMYTFEAEKYKRTGYGIEFVDVE